MARETAPGARLAAGGTEMLRRTPPAGGVVGQPLGIDRAGCFFCYSQAWE